MSARLIAGVACFAALTMAASAPDALANEVSLGVFLPQSEQTTNAERSAYAQSLADALTAATGGAVTFRARTFARRGDVMSFIAAKRVDVLVTDGLLVDEIGGDVVAHAAPDPAVALYGAPGSTVASLRGQVVAIAEAGSDDVDFYANTALSGELAARTWFGEVRRTKDASAALSAVRTDAASAAFAPAGHPASAGLELLAEGGAQPIAVVMVLNPTSLDPSAREAVVRALLGGAGVGGGIDGWAAGAGAALERARRLKRTPPRVTTTQPLLAEAADRRLTPPPLRMRATGRVNPPRRAPAASVQPVLEDP